MNVVDSSGWLEYFSGGPQARWFQEPIQKTDELIVPAICIYEVFKVVSRQAGENQAIKAIAFMKEGLVKEITERLALEGAKLSMAHKLPMADSLILAVSRQSHATLWTQDDDFKGLENVRYYKKSG